MAKLKASTVCQADHWARNNRARQKDSSPGKEETRLLRQLCFSSCVKCLLLNSRPCLLGRLPMLSSGCASLDYSATKGCPFREPSWESEKGYNTSFAKLLLNQMCSNTSLLLDQCITASLSTATASQFFTRILHSFWIFSDKSELSPLCLPFPPKF